MLHSTSELNKSNIKYDLVAIAEDVHTVEDVQRACDCSKQVVIKSLLLVGNMPMMALVPGDKQLDLSKLRKAVGDSTLSMAKPEQVIKLTGYKVGAVSPFGLPKIGIIADSSIVTLSELIVGSGKSNILIRIPITEFKKIYKGSFESIAT